MIYFEVQDRKGKILAGNMQEFSDRKVFENGKIFSKHQRGIGLRSAFESIGDIDVWVTVKDEKDLLLSSKLFNKTFELYKIVSLAIYDHHKKEIGAYAHMLETIQAQIRQKIDNFAVQDEFYGETYQASVKNIQSIVKVDQESAADLICYIQKRVVDMRAQLLGSEVIHSGECYELKFTEVSLKRAILNQYTPFLEGFDNKQVKLKFFFDDDCKVMVDKNMFSLIMYNFFSNALKYTKPNSEIRFNYSKDQKNLDISMISLKMERDELTDLHKEGVRGIHARDIPGKGIGLFVICRALDLMKMSKMYISPVYEKTMTEEGVTYAENHFIFSL